MTAKLFKDNLQRICSSLTINLNQFNFKSQPTIPLLNVTSKQLEIVSYVCLYISKLTCNVCLFAQT